MLSLFGGNGAVFSDTVDDVNVNTPVDIAADTEVGSDIAIETGRHADVKAGSLVEEFAVSEVAPGIYLHQGRHEQMSISNRGDIVNSGFIIGEDAVAVIDPGGSVHNARLLDKAIKAHTLLPVRYVVLSHIHPDHVAGVSVFAQTSKVIAHHYYPRALAQRGQFYLERFPELYGAGTEEALRVPDILVDESLIVDLGGRLLTINAYTTGHTDHDLSVFDQSTKTLFASDLLFAQRTPSLDGSLSGWLDVLQNLHGEDYALVIPGHGQPGSWASIALPQVRYLNELRRSVSSHIEQGLTLSQAIDVGMRQTRANGWQLFEDVHPTNITKAYTELEWE